MAEADHEAQLRSAHGLASLPSDLLLRIAQYLEVGIARVSTQSTCLPARHHHRLELSHRAVSRHRQLDLYSESLCSAAWMRAAMEGTEASMDIREQTREQEREGKKKQVNNSNLAHSNTVLGNNSLVCRKKCWTTFQRACPTLRLALVVRGEACTETASNYTSSSI